MVGVQIPLDQQWSKYLSQTKLACIGLGLNYINSYFECLKPTPSNGKFCFRCAYGS